MTGGQGRSHVGKLLVIGALELSGEGHTRRVRLEPLGDFTAASVTGFVERVVQLGATVYLLQEQSGGDAIVYGYAVDGLFAGDTWFEALAHALESLRDQHGPELSEWLDAGTADINEAGRIALIVAVDHWHSLVEIKILGNRSERDKPLMERASIISFRRAATVAVLPRGL